jgi:hypothetical protein
LKNGSILHGRILENRNGHSLRLEIVGNNQLVINYEDIDSITTTGTRENSFASPIQVSTSVHFYGGSKSSAGFSVAPGYHFSNGITTGIGTGMDVFDYQILPVYTHIRYNLFNYRITPYLFGKAGYSFPLSKAQEDQWTNPDYKGGFMGSVGCGISTGLGTRYAFVFSVGYHYQKLKKTIDNTWYYGENVTVERIDNLNRIEVSAGFIFK